MKYKVMNAHLIVTKPDQTLLDVPVVLYVDLETKTVGIQNHGTGPLRGYCFDILRSDLQDLMEVGVLVESLPVVNA